MNIGFTGTREGMTKVQRTSLKEYLRDLKLENLYYQFHHGDCIGADEEAHNVAQRLGYEVVIHPPDNPTQRAFKKAYLIFPEQPYLVRNREIVDCTELLIATPKEDTEQPRGGTWYTVRYAKKLKRPITIIYPNGNYLATYNDNLPRW